MSIYLEWDNGNSIISNKEHNNGSSGKTNDNNGPASDDRNNKGTRDNLGRPVAMRTTRGGGMGESHRPEPELEEERTQKRGRAVRRRTGLARTQEDPREQQRGDSRQKRRAGGSADRGGSKRKHGVKTRQQRRMLRGG